MKKALLLSLFLAILFSCEKEDLNPEYPFTITVLTIADSVRVPNTRVEVLAPTNSGAFVAFFEGYTNEQGQVSFKYNHDAVFSVRATRGSTPITYIGCADVKLQPNEHVYKNVYMSPYDPEAVGCTYP